MNRHPEIQTSTLIECARALYPELTWQIVAGPYVGHPRWSRLIHGERVGSSADDYSEITVTDDGSTGLRRAFRGFSRAGCYHKRFSLDSLINHARDVERLRAYATADPTDESATDVALIDLCRRYVDAMPDGVAGTTGPERVMNVVRQFENDPYLSAIVTIRFPSGESVSADIPPRDHRPALITVTL